jgi:hypothetical protein
VADMQFVRYHVSRMERMKSLTPPMHVIKTPVQKSVALSLSGILQTVIDPKARVKQHGLNNSIHLNL